MPELVERAPAFYTFCTMLTEIPTLSLSLSLPPPLSNLCVLSLALLFHINIKGEKKH
jgi:hypothetical protein